MNIATDIPWTEFDGYLKQHAHEDLSPLERNLFEFLFPRFEGDQGSIDHVHDQWLDSEMVDALGGLITQRKGDARNRRFAGWHFPRRRYFSLAGDATGDDAQTLAHELRAYRNPVDAGMVEVIDLATGVQFVKEGIQLGAEPAIAVLIHEPRRLPNTLKEIPLETLPGLSDSPVRMYRFPYKIQRRPIGNVIDLRLPGTRSWFFHAFQAPSHHLEGWDFTTAYSRFHLENKRPPTPASFSDMLPTLLNPDLGGGNPGTTGSTLQSIGFWLRHNGCAALIYPSARADLSVIFDQGEMVNWTGWNLVLYEGSNTLRGATYARIDHSPWAWVRLPEGVQAHVPAEGTKHAGSFAVSGMVDYSAREYIGQVEALKTARRIHGWEGEHGNPGLLSRSRAFFIGVLALRWLRLAINGTPAETVRGTVDELVGLSLPYDLYDITGRTRELCSGLYQLKGADVGRCMRGCLAVTECLVRCLTERYSRHDLGRLLQLGWDLEFVICCAATQLATSKQGLAIAEHSTAVVANLRECVELGDDLLLKELEAFYTRGSESLRHGSPERVRAVLDSGDALVTQAYQALKE